MNPVTVCAIILDYFGADKTEACLRSLIGQGLDTVCVIDNSAAADASAHLLAAVDRLRAAADYQIEVLSPGQNLGFAKGVNYALNHHGQRQPRHDYFLLINNDALAGPELVRGLLLALQQEPQAALAAPRIISSDRGRERGIWYHRYLGLLLSKPGRLRFHYFTGCCLLIPRQLIADRALFDDSFFMYGEDTELGWRLTCQGQKMICATQVYVEHEYGPSVDRSSLFYEYHMMRAHLLLGKMTYRNPIEIPFMVCTKSIVLAVRALLRSFRYRTLRPVGAWMIAWWPTKTWFR